MKNAWNALYGKHASVFPMFGVHKKVCTSLFVVFGIQHTIGQHQA
jgi:hypothetical protein